MNTEQGNCLCCLSLTVLREAEFRVRLFLCSKIALKKYWVFAADSFLLEEVIVWLVAVDDGFCKSPFSSLASGAVCV